MDMSDRLLRPGHSQATPSLKKDGSGGDNSEVLASVGFLEACAPRMVELVEAAAQGAVSEDVLMKCLSVNDRLIKQLADIDTIAMTETAASTTAAASPPAQSSNEEDLLFEVSSDSPAAVSAATKTTGEEDEEDSKEKALAQKELDDFDDFLSG